VVGALSKPAVSWATRRPVASAAAAYLLLSLVLFAPGLAPGRTLSASDLLWSATPWAASKPAAVPPLGSNFEQADAVTQFQPPLQAVKAALPDIPLWDPSALGGRPLVADPQSQVFSPWSVPAYVLPFWKSLAVTAVLKVFVAAFGAFLLGRTLRMRFAGALLTGLVFGFSLWAVSWVSWTLGSVWVVLPWVCLLSELCVRRPGPLPVAGLATAVGLQFLGGHPSSSFQVLVVVALGWTVRTLVSRELRPRFVVRLLALGGGLAGGAALAAIMLIPFVELLALSSDIEERSGASQVLSQPAHYLGGLVLHDWWGHGATSLVFGAQQQERAYYVGVLPLLLAVTALIARPRPERIAVVAVGAAALSVATGVSPLYDLVVALPGFQAANNGRVAVIAVLCLAVLAGWGLDELIGSPLTARRRRALLGVATVLLIAPVAAVVSRLDPDALGGALRVAWGFSEPTAELASPDGGGLAGLIRLASVLEWLVLAGAALVLVALALRGRVAGVTVAALALGLVSVDLVKAGRDQNPAIPIDHATQPATGAIRFLQERPGVRFAGLKQTTPGSLILPLPPNVAVRYGLSDARGYVLPTEKRYFRIWQRAIAADRGCYYFFCTVLTGSQPSALRALGLFGVGHLLQDPRDAPVRGLRVAYEAADARVLVNPQALPRAFLVGRQQVVAGEQAALAAVTAAGFTPRVVAVTEERVPGVPAGAPGGDIAGASSGDTAGAPAGDTAAASPGAVRVTAYERERVAVQSAARSPALLVLTDTWFPGWKATVDGRDATVHRVNYATRGVAVPAGSHRVELRYEPASWRAGWIVTLVTLVTLAAAVVLGTRRRRAGDE
jgi:hypothetical protein